MGVLNTTLITTTALAAGANIPVGTIAHKSCGNLNASGNTWKISGAGYYKITVSVTLEPTAADAITLTMDDNGATIAQATETPSAAGASVNLGLVGLVFNKCGCMEDNITLTVSAAGNVTQADIVIEKIK